MKTKLILASLLISTPLMAFDFQTTEIINNTFTRICVKSESDGSGTKSESDGSGTKSESDGSGTKSESDGSGTNSESDGSGTNNYCILIPNNNNNNFK